MLERLKSRDGVHYLTLSLVRLIHKWIISQYLYASFRLIEPTHVCLCGCVGGGSVDVCVCFSRFVRALVCVHFHVGFYHDWE